MTAASPGVVQMNARINNVTPLQKKGFMTSFLVVV
jgi:hypothetical protein